MKTETLNIDDVEYEIVMIGMDDGFDLIKADGGVDTAGMIRASVRINGKQPERNEIPLSHAQKLVPIVMELNGMGEESGNES